MSPYNVHDDFSGEGVVLSEVSFIPASGVTPENFRWVWNGWIPAGMLSLLLGLPGRGKTTPAELLAADVTRGRLAGHLLGKPANVLIVSYEDAIAQTLVPRLIAAEADLDRVDFVTCKDPGQILDLTRHLPEIERGAANRAVKLLVIDPLVADCLGRRSTATATRMSGRSSRPSPLSPLGLTWRRWPQCISARARSAPCWGQAGPSDSSARREASWSSASIPVTSREREGRSGSSPTPSATWGA